MHFLSRRGPSPLALDFESILNIFSAASGPYSKLYTGLMSSGCFFFFFNEHVVVEVFIRKINTPLKLLFVLIRAVTQGYSWKLKKKRRSDIPHSWQSSVCVFVCFSAA